MQHKRNIDDKSLFSVTYLPPTSNIFILYILYKWKKSGFDEDSYRDSCNRK